jgi:MFS transporter, PPP family, 3-phenylpropionic acid transporter
MRIEAQASSRPLVGRQLLAPKVYYFCFYGAMAFLVPFLVLHYRQIGLSSSQIGLLTGIGPLATLVSAPLWGALADAKQQHKRLLLVAITGSMAMVLALSYATSLFVLLPVVVGYAFFSAPIMPLVDNSVMALLGERKERYGKQRMWGALGWGISGALAGVIIQQTGLGAAFVGFLVIMGAGLIAAAYLTVTPATIGGTFWAKARVLASNRQLAVFLATVFVSSIAMGVTNFFLFLYLEDLGATTTLMGLSLTVATVSELPIFFFSDSFLRRWGAKGLLSIALFAQVLRMVSYALMPTAWFVLPIHLLHGLTFSAMWVAGVSYANEIAPPGMGATAQGLFTATTMGLGAAGGAVIGGLLYDRIGPAQLFGWMAVCVAVGWVVFALLNRAKTVQVAV